MVVVEVLVQTAYLSVENGTARVVSVPNNVREAPSSFDNNEGIYRHIR